ncbi:MAG: hypothetical protein OXF02_07210 [Simkaniaceae bacterium]|nr:hypothetical protein [Simkaniaceae bacterium]
MHAYTKNQVGPHGGLKVPGPGMVTPGCFGAFGKGRLPGNGNASSAGVAFILAISYGPMAQAIIALYGLENSFSQLQALQSKIAQTLFKLQNKAAIVTGQMFTEAADKEAESIRAQGIGSLTGGITQGAMGIGGASYARKGYEADKDIKDLDTLREKWTEGIAEREGTANVNNAPTPAARARMETERDNMEKAILDGKPTYRTADGDEVRIADHPEKVKEVSQLSNTGNDDRILKKLKEQKDEARQNRSNALSERSNAIQLLSTFANAFTSLAQGGSQTAAATYKAQEGVLNAAKTVSQTTTEISNASGAIKAMDSLADSMVQVIVKTMEGLRQSNHFQPGS